MIAVAMLALWGCAQTSRVPKIPIPPSQREKIITSERIHFNSFFHSSRDLIRSLYSELLNLETAAAAPPPIRFNGYWLSSIQPKGLRNPIIIRTEHLPQADDQSPQSFDVLLDVNQARDMFPHVELGVVRPSPDGSMTAITLAERLGQPYKLFVFPPNTPLSSAQYVPLPDEKFSAIDIQWSDSSSFLYVTYGTDFQASALGMVALSKDPLMVQELQRCTNEAENLFVRRSESGQYIYTDCQTATTSAVHVFDTLTDHTFPFEFHNDSPAARLNFHHSGSRVLLSEFSAASDPQLFQVLIKNRSTWSKGPEIPLPSGFLLEEVRSTSHAFLLRGRAGLTPILLGLEPQTLALHEIALPFSEGSLRFLPDHDYTSGTTRLALDRYDRPTTNFLLDLDHYRVRPENNSDIPRYPIETHMLHAIATDGTEVPITIVHSDQDSLTKPRPTLLVGYGAYGATVLPEFKPEYIVLIQHGFRIAIAHVRGGGVFGEKWHRVATALGKPISFSDFEACAQFLIRGKITQPDTLFAYGRSAGGLLVTGTAASNSFLFQGLLLDRPFVSVWNTLNNPRAPFRIREFDEWGDPSNDEVKRVIQGYDPAMVMPEQPFPPTLISAAVQDEVISFDELISWSYQTRERNKHNRIVMDISTENSHRGPERTEEALLMKAHQIAFLMKQIQ